MVDDDDGLSSQAGSVHPQADGAKMLVSVMRQHLRRGTPLAEGEFAGSPSNSYRHSEVN